MLKQESIPTIEAPVPLTHTSNSKGDKCMKLHRFHFTFFLLICLLIPLTATAQPVDIPDPNLRAAIESALNKQAGDPITVEEMATLTRLKARNANISNLTGLEHATNLTALNLDSNSISDISAVTGLTKLTNLYLAYNSISDISAVTGLTNLTGLDLGGNSISDISAVTGLTKLTDLYLYNNSISDISAVTGLTNLTGLDLGDNSISDISAVTGLTNLTWLSLGGNSISDISAVTGLTNLTWLGLGFNSISDISAVTGLTKLTELYLSNNSISDISAVTGLTNLTSLGLEYNSISDISAVTGLTNLTWLSLGGNSISDISAVTGLTNLTWLGLGFNSISDISAVTGLTNLTSLGLWGNLISDISPLVTNTGLGDGDTIDVRGNPLNYSSFYTHIPTLQSRGITVEFNNRTPTTLLKISSTITESDNMLVVEVRDSEGQPFAGVPVMFTVTSGGGTLSVTSTTTDTDGRAESTLTLGADGENTVSASVEGISDTVTFSDEPEEGVHIPDPNLRAAIESALNKQAGDPITVEEMETLTYLEARDANISVLIGLEHATNLTWLNLGDNSISDISAVTGLTNLTWLFLVNNSISDISAVTGLTNLTELILWGNSISDISAVTGLTNLTALNLDSNSISDISAVTGLTNLTALRLHNNSISDISPLVANTGLGGGDDVYMVGNPLSYSSIYTHIPTLQSRGVTVEFDNRTPTTLLKISSTITESDNVLIVEVRDGEGELFAGVPVTFTVTSGGGTLSTTSTTTDIDGRAESTLTLGADGENTVSASVEGISETVTFSDVPEEGVHIPDPNLRAAIESALNKQAGDPITAEEMATLRYLLAYNANISNLTGLEHATNPTSLDLSNNSISDISALSGLTNLTSLNLVDNLISDISALSGLTNLTGLTLAENSISDISALSGLTNLTALSLDNNSISDISALSGLTNLTWLSLDNNSISDISALSGLTNLTALYINYNSISDISTLSGLTNLTSLVFFSNSISDISALSGLTNLTWLNLSNNSTSDISAVTGLTKLTLLNLSNNSISDISAVTGLTKLTSLFLSSNSISDISPLVANTGLGSGDQVYVQNNPLSYSSFYTHIPTLQSRGVTVWFDDTPPATIDFDLSVPEGISLIHVPLKVTAVDGVAKTIESVGDLYDALGGAANVSVLITYNPQTQRWNSYLGDRYRGRPGDRTLTDDLGIIASMKAPTSIRLSGAPLGTNGSSSITLQKGLNLVGVPLKDSRITKVSDLLALDGIRDNVSVIIGSDAGAFKLVVQAGDPGDVELTGGGSFIMTAREMATVAITGDAWANAPGTTAAPPRALTGIQVAESTPILAVTGSIVSPVDGASLPRPLGSRFRVTIKNLSTGKADTTVTDDDGVGYQLTFVDIETGRAAQIGDTLEFTAQSLNPLVRVQPGRYVVTAEDVKRGHIQLGTLVAYEIPAKTELLRNYPNPFNPETWIPYRLAADANVTLTIYDLSGGVVRRLNIGHRIAAVYESRSKAIYWDGRTEFGERVASGIYFYHLSAGDYSATRKMVILK